MASEKRKYVKVTTPVGVAVWPKLNAPDTKYKANGEFGVKLALSADEAQPLIDQYQAELKKAFAATKATLLEGDGKSKAAAKALKLSADLPYKPDVDDEGEENGNILFNFKMPHRIEIPGKKDLLLHPAIFDAKGKSLKNPPEIWGGSKLIIAGELRPYYTAKLGVGVSLRLNAVQIVELTTKGERSAEGYGFGAQEGGYEGTDEFPGDRDTAGDEAASEGGATGVNNNDF